MPSLVNNNLIQDPVRLFSFLSALSDKVRTHFDSLGQSAKDLLESTNSKGDLQLIGDIECEKIVIEELRLSGLRCIIFSEEHGMVDLTQGQKALCTIVLDGLDGSKYAQQDLKSDFYGTVIGILQGDNPLYSDAVATSFVRHARSLNQIFTKYEAMHQELGWQYEFISRNEIVVSIDAPIVKHNPRHYEKLMSAFPDFITTPSGKSISDLIQGGCDAFVRRLSNGSLELAGFSAALMHGRAVARTLSGKNLWELPYKENKDSGEVVVVARSEEIADRIIRAME